MGGENIVLQNRPLTTKASIAARSAQFNFIVDTCKNLATLTGSTDLNCDSTFLDEDIDDILVTVKKVNQFFSSKTFMANGEQLTDQFDTSKFVLSPSISNNIALEVQRKQTKFTSRVFYQDQLT